MPKNRKHVEAAKKAWSHYEDWNVSEVLADLPHEVQIGPHGSKKALSIKVWSGEEHIGTLHIGKGGVQWRFGKKRYPPLNWRQFAERMTWT